jgi:protein-disulfide isomerase
MQTDIKVIIGIILTTLVIVGGGVYLATRTAKKTTAPTYSPAIVTRATSHSTRPLPTLVTVVEFGDYQCPACGYAYPTVEKVMEHYKDDTNVSFVFRHFPLSQHKNELPAAHAAEAAALQGKFWEMNHLLYTKQNEWSEKSDPSTFITTYAQTLGLDMDRFVKDSASNTVADIVAVDLKDATALSLDHTPTFIINNNRVNELPTYDKWITLIDQAKKDAGVK